MLPAEVEFFSFLEIRIPHQKRNQFWNILHEGEKLITDWDELEERGWIKGKSLLDKDWKNSGFK